MSSRSAPAFVLGSALRWISEAAIGLIKTVGVLMWRTGAVWVAGYAVYGAVLYAIWGFDPFSGGGVWTGMFWTGGALCAMLFIVTAAKNFVSHPVEAAKEGYENPVWEKRAPAENPSRRRRFTEEQRRDKPYSEYRNVKNGSPYVKKVSKAPAGKTARERPKVYMSGLEDRLIYEYSDRFEVYIVDDDVKTLERIEFKDIA